MILRETLTQVFQIIPTYCPCKNFGFRPHQSFLSIVFKRVGKDKYGIKSLSKILNTPFHFATQFILFDSWSSLLIKIIQRSELNGLRPFTLSIHYKSFMCLISTNPCNINQNLAPETRIKKLLYS